MNRQKGTPLKVFSVIKNCESFLKGKDADINSLVSEVWFQRSPDFIVRQCKRIWNDIENSLYEYVDLKLFILWQGLFHNKYTIKDINDKNINSIKERFTDRQFKKDKQILLGINENVKLESIEEYFTIREGGTSYIYDLILKNYLSPIIFVKCYDKLNVNQSLGSESDEYKNFLRITNEIKRQTKNDKVGGPHNG